MTRQPRTNDWDEVLAQNASASTLIAEIKRRWPCKDYFRAHLTGLVAGKGGWYKAFCPFHDDDTGNRDKSFGVRLDSGKWRCHKGCGHGDIIDFYRKKNNLNAKKDFKRALHLMAGEIGLDPSEHERVIAVPALDVLEVKKWLTEQRGFTLTEVTSMWAAARTGMGPAVVFRYQNIDGVCIYEKIRLTQEKVLWRQPEGAPTMLYGLAQMAQCNEERIIIVEGELDLHALRCVGIRDVVSLPDGSGTSVTSELIEPLRRFKRVVLATDADDEGDKVAGRVSTAFGWGGSVCYRARFRGKDGTFINDANDALLAGWSKENYEAAFESAEPCPPSVTSQQVLPASDESTSVTPGVLSADRLGQSSLSSTDATTSGPFSKSSLEVLDSRLSPSERNYIQHLRLMSRNGAKPVTASDITLAGHFNVSTRTVERWNKRLEALGMMRRERRGQGKTTLKFITPREAVYGRENLGAFHRLLRRDASEEEKRLLRSESLAQPFSSDPTRMSGQETTFVSAQDSTGASAPAPTAVSDKVESRKKKRLSKETAGADRPPPPPPGGTQPGRTLSHEEKEQLGREFAASPEGQEVFNAYVLAMMSNHGYPSSELQCDAFSFWKLREFHQKGGGDMDKTCRLIRQVVEQWEPKKERKDGQVGEVLKIPCSHLDPGFFFAFADRILPLDLTSSDSASLKAQIEALPSWEALGERRRQRAEEILRLRTKGEQLRQARISEAEEVPGDEVSVGPQPPSA